MENTSYDGTIKHRVEMGWLRGVYEVVRGGPR